MSRVRTGLGPDDWLDQGEAAARVMGHGGRMLGEYIVSAVTPLHIPTPAETEGRKRREARAKALPAYQRDHQGRKYETAAEREEGRRRTWRDAQQRRRLGGSL